MYEASMCVLFETTTNAYIMAGTTSNLQGFDAVLIIKVDQFGDTIWMKSIDLTLGIDNVNYSCFSNAGYYIFCGTTKDSLGIGTDAFLMEVDTSGNLIWFKRYGGSANDVGQMVKMTRDGGYIMAGWASSNSNGLEDGFAVKTDSVGNIQWQQHYGDSLSDVFMSVDFVEPTGYIFGGKTFSYAIGWDDLWLVRTDSLGNFLWQQTFGTPNNDYGQTTISTKDSGFVIVGAIEAPIGNTDAYIVKTDKNGVLQWDRTFGTLQDYESFVRVIQLQNGNIVAVGSSQRNYYEGMVVEYNEIGDTVWSKYYRINSISSHHEHYLYGLAINSVEGFAFTGMTIQSDLIVKNDAWLIITDSLGCDNASCVINGLIEIRSYKNEIHVANPFSDIITLYFDKSSNENCEAMVYDMSGRLCESYIFKSQSVVTLQDRNLSGGFYLLSLICSDNYYNYKLFKP